MCAICEANVEIALIARFPFSHAHLMLPAVHIKADILRSVMWTNWQMDAVTAYTYSPICGFSCERVNEGLSKFWQLHPICNYTNMHTYSSFLRKGTTLNSALLHSNMPLERNSWLIRHTGGWKMTLFHWQLHPICSWRAISAVILASLDMVER